MEQNSIYKQFRCVVRSEVEPRDKNVLWWNMNDSALYSFYNGIWIKEHDLEVKDLINKFNDLKNTVIIFDDKIENVNNSIKNLDNLFNNNLENTNNKINLLENNISYILLQTDSSILNIVLILENKGISLDNFGGIICLTLGNSLDTENIQKCISILNDILTNKKHYIVTIYDTVDNKFYGDCEVVYDGKDSMNIISNYASTTLTQYTIYYSFKTNDITYTRNKYSVSIASKGSVDKLLTYITNLESRISALEQLI